MSEGMIHGSLTPGHNRFLENRLSSHPLNRTLNQLNLSPDSINSRLNVFLVNDLLTWNIDCSGVDLSCEFGRSHDWLVVDDSVGGPLDVHVDVLSFDDGLDEGLVVDLGARHGHSTSSCGPGHLGWFGNGWVSGDLRLGLSDIKHLSLDEQRRLSDLLH